jgi:hypothetical protein
MGSSIGNREQEQVYMVLTESWKTEERRKGLGAVKLIVSVAGMCFDITKEYLLFYVRL